jgi:hypothetical protein
MSEKPADPAAEPPHDVLAAEAFAVGGADPGLHGDEAHDVLAAEEFGVPAPDPSLHHGPLVVPSDVSGVEDPHDVLAAEEFAVPAAEHHAVPPGEWAGPGGPPASAGLSSFGVGLAAVFLLWSFAVLRRRRRARRARRARRGRR